MSICISCITLRASKTQNKEQHELNGKLTLFRSVLISFQSVSKGIKHLIRIFYVFFN